MESKTLQLSASHADNNECCYSTLHRAQR